jgi:hypothetical protein
MDVRCAGHIARMGEKRNVCRIFVGKPEGKRPLGRLTHRWESNIKLILEKSDGVALSGFNWLRIEISGGLL